MDFMNLAAREAASTVKMRRHLHEYPEVGGQEEKTVRFVLERLRSLGIRCEEVPGGGVLGFLGDKGEDAPRLLMRADMDALPIRESPLNGGGLPKPCVSLIPGVQHACGHDAHTAILLSAAKILKENESALSGNVLLFFERGEETSQLYCGYPLLKRIEEEGLRVDGAWAMHVFGEGYGASAHLSPGPIQAGNFAFSAEITGRGGHGARPDHAASPVDCFLSIGAQLAGMRLNSLTPWKPATYSIGMVHAGDAPNIIPQALAFAGTGRFYDREEIGEPMRRRIREIVEGCAALHHCRCALHIAPPGYPVINHRGCFDIAREAFLKLLPAERVVEVTEPMMGSESFAFVSALYPSMFAYFGVANREKGMTAGVHTPEFDVDEDALPTAVALTAAYAEAFLRAGPPEGFEPFAGGVDRLYAPFLPGCQNTASFDIPAQVL